MNEINKIGNFRISRSRLEAGRSVAQSDLLGSGLNECEEKQSWKLFSDELFAILHVALSVNFWHR